MKKTVKYEKSSGNVFADLEFENPEEALAKSELARQIAKAVLSYQFKPDLRPYITLEHSRT